jgi:hypothetical protein
MRTAMTKLIVVFRNFAKAPKTVKMTKKCSTPQYYMMLEIVCTRYNKKLKVLGILYEVYDRIQGP